MSKIKICIFDMDGLLVDTERGMWCKNEMKAIETMGFVSDFEIVKSVMGTPYMEYKYTIAEKYGPTFDPDKFVELVLKYNDDDLNSGNINLMPGCKELLEYLSINNIKAVVGTSSSVPLATSLLTKLNVIQYFDKVYSSQDVGKSKPHPDIFLACLGDYKKEEALVFEDSHNGAKAAINASIPLILIPDLIEVTDEEKNKAFSILNSLDQAIKIIEDLNK